MYYLAFFFLVTCCGAVNRTWDQLSPAGVPSYGTLGIPDLTTLPPARAAGAAVCTSLECFMFGGRNTNNDKYNDLWEFDPSTSLWAWISGSNDVNQGGVYGTKGEFASTNVPGARSDAIAFTDNVFIYIFGGLADGWGTPILNDLWRFNLTSSQWAWISGSDQISAVGVYGTKNVPNPDNAPGARYRPTGLFTAGAFYLFGGYGLGNVLGSTGVLNDVWMFNVSSTQWTWIAGADTINDEGQYGTKGQPDPANSPPARQSSSIWATSDALYMYGGAYYESAFADMWEFSLDSQEWTWLGGYQGDTSSWTPVFGNLGTPSVNNTPSTRYLTSSWTGSDGFYLFGGYTPSGYVNDMWKYDPATNEWTWTAGSKQASQLEVLTNDTCQNVNTPGASSLSVTWEFDDKFYLFAGQEYSDLKKRQVTIDDNAVWSYADFCSPPPPTSSSSTSTSSSSSSSTPSSTLSSTSNSGASSTSSSRASSTSNSRTSTSEVSDASVMSWMTAMVVAAAYLMH